MARPQCDTPPCLNLGGRSAYIQKWKRRERIASKLDENGWDVGPMVSLTAKHHEHEHNNSSVTQNLRGWNLNGWKHHHISRWKPKIDKLSAVDGGGRKGAFVFLAFVFFFFLADYLGQHNYVEISSFKSAWCLELSGYSLFLVCVRDIFVVVWRMCFMECMKQTIYWVPRALNTPRTKFFILVVVFAVAKSFGVKFW